MNLSRKSFLTTGAAAISGAAFAGVASTAFGLTAEEVAGIDWDYESDVVVVGCGSGGAPAVLGACDAGNTVTVVEKMDWLGGSMRRCGGGIMAAGSCVQRALGVEDSADDLYDYIVACSNGLADEEMLRVVADRSAEVFDWIVEDLAGQGPDDWAFTNGTDGMELAMRPGLCLSGTPVWYEYYGMSPVPRTYWFAADPDDVDEDGSRGYAPAGLLGRPDTDTGRGGTGLWSGFQRAIDERGVNVLLGHSLAELVTNEAGEVIGVRAHDLANDADVLVRANKGVVLATGDFQNNPQMMLDYTLFGWAPYSPSDPMALPEDPTAHTIDMIVGGWDIAAQGDGAGIVAAQAIGAATRYMAAGPWRGGLVTDTSARVLDVFGKPIPRLFASSFCVGGKEGTNYPLCGYYNMVNMVFGRVAAEGVSALEPWA